MGRVTFAQAAALEDIQRAGGSAPPLRFPLELERDPAAELAAEIRLRTAVSRRLTALEMRQRRLMGARERAAEIQAIVRPGSSARRVLEGTAGQPGAMPHRAVNPLESTLTARRGGDGAAGAPVQLQTNNVSAHQRITSPSASDHERRRARYELQAGLSALTDRSRVAGCGRRVGGELVAVKLERGRAHYSGVFRCGRLWLCPVCAATIATRRADQVRTVLERHTAEGGGAVLATFTARHYAADRLSTARRAIPQAFRAVISGRGWIEDRQEYGIVGQLRALEATHGRNGWHVHLHVVWLTARPLARAALRRMKHAIAGRWIAAIQRLTGRAPLVEHQKFSAVMDDQEGRAALADYVSKISAALEIARWDWKSGSGHVAGRTPFQILAALLESRREALKLSALAELEDDPVRARELERRSAAADERHLRDLALWREWEKTMHGARQLTWSRGLKERYGVDDKTDEELANEDVGGATVAEMQPVLYRELARCGALPRVLEHAEAGSLAGFLDHFTRRRWDDEGYERPPGPLYVLRVIPGAAEPTRTHNQERKRCH